MWDDPNNGAGQRGCCGGVSACKPPIAVVTEPWPPQQGQHSPAATNHTPPPPPAAASSQAPAAPAHPAARCHLQGRENHRW